MILNIIILRAPHGDILCSPDPTGELHHQVLRFNASPSTPHHHWRNAPPGPRLQTRQRRFALLGEGTESLATDARSTDAGHWGRGRWILEILSLFSSSFFLVSFYLFWLLRWGRERCRRARSWVLHVPGGTPDPT